MNASIAAVRRPQREEPVLAAILGEHARMHQLRDEVRRAARLTTPVLIVGPTGAGKELVATALHALSARAGSLVSVNVAALNDALAEAELFGAVRGAYTGSAHDRAGLVETAAGGTLFLDEAGDLSSGLQAKLLRVLESRAVRRVGATQDQRVDFRLLVSTQRTPQALVAGSQWRLDFLYRVAGVVITVPSLAERVTDVPQLVNHFLGEHGLQSVEPAAVSPLLGECWPGNVRQLRRVVERAVFLASGDPPTAEDFLHALAAEHDPTTTAPRRPVERSVGGRLRDVEAAHIEATLDALGFDTRRAAAQLGLSRSQLYRRMQALGLAPRLRQLGLHEEPHTGS